MSKIQLLKCQVLKRSLYIILELIYCIVRICFVVTVKESKRFYQKKKLKVTCITLVLLCTTVVTKHLQTFN